MKPLFLLVELLCLPLLVHSQGTQTRPLNGHFLPPVNHYTTAQGLNQMQIRDILIDFDHYVWIASQGGLNGFDGKDLQSYDLGPISEQYLMKIIKGKDCIIGKTSSLIFSFNGIDTRILTKKSLDDLTNYQILFQDGQGILWIEFKNQLLFLENGSFAPLGCLYSELEELPVRYAWRNPANDICTILTTGNTLINFKSGYGIFHRDSTTFRPEDCLEFTKFGQCARCSNIFISKKGRENTESVFLLSGSGLLNQVARTNPLKNRLEPAGEGAPLSIFEASGGKSILSTMQEGFYQPLPLPEIEHLRFCTTIGTDVLAATDNGLFVVNINGLETLNQQDIKYPWAVLPDEDGNLLVSTYRHGIFKINPSGALLDTFPFASGRIDQNTISQNLSNGIITKDYAITGSSVGFNYIRKGEHVQKHFILPRSAEAFEGRPTDNKIIVGTSIIYWIDMDSMKITDSLALPAKLPSQESVNDIATDRSSTLWVASSSGVYEIKTADSGKIVRTHSFPEFKCQGAISIEKDHLDNIWIGGTCGLLKYSRDRQAFESILPQNIHFRVNQLLMIPQRGLMCVGNNQLVGIDLTSATPVINIDLNSNNGLNVLEPSENGIACTQNRHIWIPSVNCIQRIDLDRLRPSGISPKLKILSIDNHAAEISNPGLLSYQPEAGTVLVKCIIIQANSSSFTYSYSLNGKPYSIPQTNSEVILNNLRHGRNDICIRACRDESSEQQCEYLNFSLAAELPLLHRKGFQNAILALGVMTAVYFAGVSYRMQTRKIDMANLRTDLLHNRLRTIQSYLNPHFLFNTLTTIQDYVLHKDRTEGGEMIVRLAHIFRRVLDLGHLTSTNGTKSIDLIKLSDELSLIGDMVYLQNRQQKKPIKFDVRMTDGLNTEEFKIPPLLIQPFIENAFKHAFTSENDLIPTIDLSIECHAGHLNVTIRDNGKGMSDSPDPIKSTRLGMKLAKERMEILNSLNIENNITITPASPQGTIVNITIIQMT